jgi:Holliday junction resolvasome RuvABC endonuclease subunit
MARILGLDASLTSCGWALGDTITKKIIESGCIFPVCYGEVRLKDLRNKFKMLLDVLKPDWCFIEAYAYSVQWGATYDLGEAGGIYRLGMSDFGVGYLEINSSMWKIWLSGKGKLDPKEAKKVVFEKFGLNSKVEHEVDGISLAMLGVMFYNVWMRKEPLRLGMYEEDVYNYITDFIPVVTDSTKKQKKPKRRKRWWL